MSFNGSGLFQINTAGQPVVTGTTILSTAFNALTADLATGLSTCITKDGQTTITADIPLNSHKLTGLGAASNNGEAVRWEQISAIATWAVTPSSANLRAALTDETGTGAAVFANTPTLVTPNIGAATGTSVVLTGNSITGTGQASANFTVRSSVANGGAGFSELLLGNTSTDTRGFVSYSHAAETLTLGTSGANRVVVSSTGVSVTGTLGASGDFAINTNKFNVTAASGNTTVAGTLGVTGDVAVNTNKFTVTASSGNTTIAGTLTTTGAVNQVATASATTQSANIAKTTLYAVTTTGWYRVYGQTNETAIGSISGTLPSIQVSYTPGDGAVETDALGMTCADTPGNNFAAVRLFVATVYAKTGTNISYATINYASNAATTLQYAIRIAADKI